MRGKQGCHTVKILSGGITPAGAGKTCGNSDYNVKFKDHPRRCGENALSVTALSVHAGSPPQVRGKPPEGTVNLKTKRITPAGAGKTKNQSRLFRDIRDHPRRCGENIYTKSSARQRIGSPPQVRGKPTLLPVCIDRVRITPAGAGKTRCFSNHGWLTRDHPRRCGENREHPHGVYVLAGSPPQVRGKHIYEKLRKAKNRITPAGAGKTHAFARVHRPSKDHPRRCGENSMFFKSWLVNSGSPPQVRGKPRASAWGVRAGGITPAGAGKTDLRFANLEGAEDHPRRCGENQVTLRD